MGGTDLSLENVEVNDKESNLSAFPTSRIGDVLCEPQVQFLYFRATEPFLIRYGSPLMSQRS